MDSDGLSPPSRVPTIGAGDESEAAQRFPAWLWGLMALAFGVAVSLWLAQVQKQQHQAERAAAIERVAENGYRALRSRLESCELLVRSVQTLFLASESVSDAEFAHLYENLQPRRKFPSLIALAYARREVQARSEHYITDRIAPIQGNERLFGLDIAAQPANLRAVLTSRDSDLPTLSAPFRLIQLAGQGHDADGVTLRLPVFTPGAPPRDLAQRRARMVGSLAVSFRVGHLIETAFPQEAREMLHIAVTDVTDGAALPLFDSHPQTTHTPGGVRFERDLDYGDRTWRVAMQPLRTVPARVDWAQSLLPTGLLASLLLALLAWSLAGTQRRALELGWRMSRRYRESEERFRALNELLPALVLLADGESGRVTYANQASRTRLGGALTHVTLASLFEDPDLRLQLEEPGTHGTSNAEAVLRGRDGTRFWASVSIARVQLDRRDQLLMVAADISEQRELTERLSYQASHDALTELYNRREFERRAERVLSGLAAGGQAGALLYIDLDQFKLINDTSGHIAGDQLLAQLAMVMREQLREGDVLARLGGDEFGVLVANVHDEAGVRLVAERVRERIDGYVFAWEAQTYTVSASIGAVMLSRPGLGLNELLAHADTACYMAKESGRNRVHFYSEQDDEAARRRSEMEWANRLRWAVDERRLLLRYQEVWPLARAAGDSKRIELLLRFRDEDGRLVVPGAFIPAAERYGLMPMIDRWVIETTLANFDHLHPSGSALALATINLSGASIEDESLVELILSQLETHRVDPGRVCFEITETVAVRNLSQVARFIERLRVVGCRIALDDFGAGMSSFGYLKNLPIDIIKIDGSFIRDLLTDPMSHAIVRAVTDIGHQRGLQVIAEWVTGEEIAHELVALGVDYGQGFALHEPETVVFQRD
ncbi:bifunctional diguanylate cyclase/phosphodiesterase [Montanilutibacter psychrotolerans]|uniref:EAL domain-containing protein n=1 Tax=Montanilutibacter psychrotolerans TaxID=1327343 RepID=A0A3M8T568_9GAMM|nr:EAL domain-containing protein [Lysobacter psychrotolerans]RNF85882.1 EAL domain-containing protein [Lysobacter psychrotolerans]